MILTSTLLHTMATFILTFLIQADNALVVQGNFKVQQAIPPNIPFELRKDSSNDTFGPAWEAEIILPKEHYNKLNLSRIFNWYSLKHSNYKDKLQVTVFTDVTLSNNKSPNIGDRLEPYDAIFFRQGDGAAAFGGRNEWFIYSPNITKPNIKKTVVLRGKDPFSTPRILRSFDVSTATMKIRVIEFALDRVEPKKVYYSYYYFSQLSNERTPILTVRVDKVIRKSSHKVICVNSNLCYLSVGSAFVVTTNAGLGWSIWDAAKYWSVTPESPIIVKDASIIQNGSGTMTLTAKSKKLKQLLLTTNDFGIHWQAKIAQASKY